VASISIFFVMTSFVDAVSGGRLAAASGWRFQWV